MAGCPSKSTDVMYTKHVMLFTPLVPVGGAIWLLSRGPLSALYSLNDLTGLLVGESGLELRLEFDRATCRRVRHFVATNSFAAASLN